MVLLASGRDSRVIPGCARLICDHLTSVPAVLQSGRSAPTFRRATECRPCVLVTAMDAALDASLSRAIERRGDFVGTRSHSFLPRGRHTSDRGEGDCKVLPRSALQRIDLTWAEQPFVVRTILQMWRDRRRSPHC